MTEARELEAAVLGAVERLEAEARNMIKIEGPRVTRDREADLMLAVCYPSAYRALVEAEPSEYRPVGRPGSRPGRFRKMADKACFANGQRAVLRRLGQGYVYVEGFALTLGIWWHHGWVADQEDNAIEVTWQEAGARYVGTEIDLRAVAEMASRGWLGSQLDPLEADDG